MKLLVFVCLARATTDALLEPTLSTLAGVARAVGATLCCVNSFARVDRGRGRPPVERVPYFPQQAAAYFEAFSVVLLVGAPQVKDGHLISQINTLEPGSRVLIFCSTKRMCDTLCRALARQIGCNAMHGDKEQRERERVLQEFKDGR